MSAYLFGENHIDCNPYIMQILGTINLGFWETAHLPLP